jgi:hypothetical protein
MDILSFCRSPRHRPVEISKTWEIVPRLRRRAVGCKEHTGAAGQSGREARPMASLAMVTAAG